MDQKENQFVVDDVRKTIMCTIMATLGGTTYDYEKVTQWTMALAEKCTVALCNLKNAYKYVVNCTILQKTGAGLHIASSCYWDTTADRTCTVRWQNKSMFCIVSVFVLTI